MEIQYLIPLLGLVGLVVMIFKAIWVGKQDSGDANMVELAGYIARGSQAFLRAEWRVLGVFVVIAAALLAWSAELEAVAAHTDWVIAVAFVIGAVFSAFAGWIGMNIATKANVRTTQAARTSLAQALKVSFTGGTVMGLGVAGLAVLGLGTLYIVFTGMYTNVAQALEGTTGPFIAASDYVRNVPEQIRQWVPGRYVVLGTDGYGRSDARAALRHHFEVDRRFVVLATLRALADEGVVPAEEVARAITQLGIDVAKPNPLHS